MKKIVSVIAGALLFLGCAIVPASHIVTLPPNEYEVRVNTYSSGWGWPFVPYPGIGWTPRYYHHYYGGYGHGYGRPYGYPYRWVPGRWTWEPGHYE